MTLGACDRDRAVEDLKELPRSAGERRMKDKLNPGINPQATTYTSCTSSFFEQNIPTKTHERSHAGQKWLEFGVPAKTWLFSHILLCVKVESHTQA